MARFRAWAVKYQVSVALLHHTKKGASTPGDAESARGAGDIVFAARVAFTLCTMNKEEADKFGVHQDDRRDYFRVDSGKQNYARAEDIDWIKKVEYALDNGERVAAAAPWTLLPALPDVSQTDRLIVHVEEGTDGEPYSPRLGNEPRSIRHAMVLIGVEDAKEQSKLLSRLLGSPHIKVDTYVGGVGRVPKQGLKTDNGPAAKWTTETQEENASE
jgi:hypothetical protein